MAGHWEDNLLSALTWMAELILLSLMVPKKQNVSSAECSHGNQVGSGAPKIAIPQLGTGSCECDHVCEVRPGLAPAVQLDCRVSFDERASLIRAPGKTQRVPFFELLSVYHIYLGTFSTNIPIY